METHLYGSFYQLESKHWWFIVRRKLVHKLIKLYRPHAGRLTILEVGCGTGKLLEELSAHNDTMGIDKSAEAVKFSKQRGLENVTESSIENYKTNEQFDCIIALDILEHCQDDSRAIEKIYSLLKKDGVAIIFVPALKCFWGKRDKISHHFRRYNYSELSEKFHKAHFKTLKQSYFNFFLSPLIFVARKIINLTKTEGVDLEVKINNPLINTVCKFVFNFETSLLPKIKYPFGVSLLGVFKK